MYLGCSRYSYGIYIGYPICMVVYPWATHGLYMRHTNLFRYIYNVSHMYFVIDCYCLWQVSGADCVAVWHSLLAFSHPPATGRWRPLAAYTWIRLVSWQTRLGSQGHCNCWRSETPRRAEKTQVHWAGSSSVQFARSEKGGLFLSCASCLVLSMSCTSGMYRYNSYKLYSAFMLAPGIAFSC
jgi:hypothetical protein